MNTAIDTARAVKRSYADFLGRPEWYKRRDAIIHIRGSQCESCCHSPADHNAQLEVHHRRYLPGRMPWEYEDADFLVLCSECHQAITVYADQVWNMALSLDPDFARLLVKTMTAITEKMELRPPALIAALRAASDWRNSQVDRSKLSTNL